ncbi:VWA domain-containing protein [bacterium]|nr:VWA domain-containing protein [bacterium]
MIRFANPDYLHFLWVIPVLLLIIWWEYGWRLKSMSRWASEPLWDAALPDRAPGRKLAKRLLIVLAIAMLLAALTGPQIGTRMVEVTREGSDIAIVIDVSQSMLAEDITPNRMMKARHEVVKFLGRLHGDRVALVPFAGVAFVQVPLTLDYAAVTSILHALEPGMIPQPGTSLSEAIKQARRAFREESRAQKIMLLITDGEDHEAGAIDQAKEAARENIIIYTIGMASPSGGPVPIKNTRGKITGYKQERGGGTVISRLNEKLLTDIARITGGEYFRSTAVGSEFKQIFKKVAKLDKEEFEAKEFTDYEHRFQWFLLTALLLIIAAELIPPGRLRRK